MNLVEFCEQVLDLKLLPYQKKILHDIENHKKYDNSMCFQRENAQSRYIFGWVYKSMWEQYCNTGKIEFPFHVETDSESFQKEYECIWSNENEI